MLLLTQRIYCCQCAGFAKTSRNRRGAKTTPRCNIGLANWQPPQESVVDSTFGFATPSCRRSCWAFQLAASTNWRPNVDESNLTFKPEKKIRFKSFNQVSTGVNQAKNFVRQSRNRAITRFGWQPSRDLAFKCCVTVNREVLSRLKVGEERLHSWLDVGIGRGTVLLR